MVRLQLLGDGGMRGLPAEAALAKAGIWSQPQVGEDLLDDLGLVNKGNDAFLWINWGGREIGRQ